MKKLVLASMMAASLSQASAGLLVDFYAGATASTGQSITFIPNGTTLPSSKDLINQGNSFGAVVGIDIPVVRIEGEYNYIAAKDVKLHAGMLNGYLKLLPTPFIKPYIGAGIGSVFAGKIGGDLDQDADKSIAYQGMLGFQFDIPATPIFFDIEGRVFYAQSIYAFDSPINKDVGFLQYDARAKIRFVF